MMTLTSQIWVELLIGRKFSSSNKKLYADLGTDASPVWNLCDHFAGKAPVASRNIGCFQRQNRKEMGTISFLQLLFSRAYESDFHFHWGYKGFTTPIEWLEKSSLKSINDNLNQSKYSIQINHLLKEMEAELLNYLRCKIDYE